jgi:hypothetical protein
VAPCLGRQWWRQLRESWVRVYRVSMACFPRSANQFFTEVAEPARTLDARDAVARRAGDRAIALACSPGLSRFRARFSRPIILKPHGNVGRDEKRLSQCPGSREARC